ncbi:hypothetical protein OAO01_09385, partial [Oligoflexia bacterium]|nr:hypothetical protein [Oligoflexia bacterium]
MSDLSPLEANIIFFGTPDFAVFSLKALLDNPAVNLKLVVTQPDKPAGRGAKLTSSPVKQLALAHNIPVLQPTQIRKDVSTFIAQAQAS